MHSQLLQTEWLAAVGSSVLLDIWWMIFIVWLTVLIVWVRTLMAYGEQYGKYEQACREYQKSYGQLPENLRLIQERLHEEDQRFGMMLKRLRRLEAVLRNAYMKCNPCKLAVSLGVLLGNNRTSVRLHVSGGRIVKPISRFNRVYRECCN